MKRGGLLLLACLAVACSAYAVKSELVYHPQFTFFRCLDSHGIWTAITLILWLTALLPVSFRKMGYLPTLPLRAVLSCYIATPLIFMMCWSDLDAILGGFAWVLLLSQPIIVFSALIATPGNKVVCGTTTAILAALYFFLPVFILSIIWGGCPMS